MPSQGDLQDEITGILRAAEIGGDDPIERLWPLIYDDLRMMAHEQLRRERPGHTLVTTALVHEVYLRMVDSTQVARKGRAYFFAAAARAMRQILVDHARRRQRRKRTPGEDPVLGPEQIGLSEFAAELVDLDAALSGLTRAHPRPARVVECRFFGGLTVEETADALSISPRTVKGDWALARAWLFRALHPGGGSA